MRVKARDRETDRLILLRRELSLAGVSSRRFFPSWARPKAMREGILRELLVALEAPVHEGLIPPYGSIIAPRSADFSSILSLEDKDLGLARRSADGSSALLAFRETNLVGLLFLDPSGAPDLQLAQISRALDGIGIRRERTGVVRLYGPIGSLRHAGRQWSISPAIDYAIHRIHQVASMVDWGLLSKLLEFAYYVLSPWYIGATLVWMLTDRNPFGVKEDLRPLRD